MPMHGSDEMPIRCPAGRHRFPNLRVGARKRCDGDSGVPIPRLGAQAFFGKLPSNLFLELLGSTPRSPPLEWRIGMLLNSGPNSTMSVAFAFCKRTHSRAAGKLSGLLLNPKQECQRGTLA